MYYVNKNVNTPLFSRGQSVSNPVKFVYLLSETHSKDCCHSVKIVVVCMRPIGHDIVHASGHAVDAYHSLILLLINT